ncbi:alpha/beta fold hydrolase [Belliella kenyensis]|uniref:Alpha/beta fold hydrolase n=1 Tax=Belliella kenyensis TaxID=1472724 RepID=A0ABV8EJB2_9BACT|nr:alpha/beta hydrolase [Belliella kenyensis]MCH7401400.1 alpha/beta hydrolase [Belliella kenyensis]MDN3602843.1 alpha/beta hydrolase [Belliella kenyensis]
MISYTKQGKGKPVIFLHGFCEAKEMWSNFATQLAGLHTVYCLDLPGFGKDEYDEPLPRSLEELAVLLQEWLDAMEINQPVLIGHSLGGYVALAMTELMGSDLAGVGLFHSTAFSDDEEKRHTRNKTIDFINKHGVDKFIESFVPPLFPEASRSRLEMEIAELIDFGKMNDSKTVITYIEMMRDRKDRFEVWHSFDRPKLMIAGVLDAAVKIEGSRAHKSGASLYYELEGVGHMGMYEDPNNSLAIVREFLTSL